MRAPEELIEHLCRVSALSPAEAAKVAEEVVAFFGETVEGFVRRRHAQLQASGAGNRDIFPALRAEIAGRRFRAAELSERQLRRMVYG